METMPRRGARSFWDFAGINWMKREILTAGPDMKLLIVEDELKTMAYLKRGFEENGFPVHATLDGDEGLKLARSGAFNLVILDVMLPGLSGWEVIREMRAGGCTTPVIFLTARDRVVDRVRGLDLGADDYLVKPFDFSELLARVRTLLRRHPLRQPESVSLGDLIMIRSDAWRGGRSLNLSRQEFLLLALLVDRRGEVLSRAEIAQQVWDMNFDSLTNVVDVAIGRLRRKVDDPFEVKLIHTVKGLGYVMEVR
jgi:two-component system copper resistance phosphate regulon response regulator CusR